ncbi:MAG: hypothetical protein ACREBG_16620 [Pyrinomonadaceae bacterium]
MKGTGHLVQIIDPALKNALLSADFRAAVIMWNRLEGRPRKEDFDRSLRAEVRDPLWMLTRQWQFGEFKGEDAGSAVKARVQLNTSKIDRYAVKSETRDATGGEQFLNAVPYDQSFPLEIAVEREPVLPPGPEPNITDLALRARMGRHWSRLLKQAGLGVPDVRTAIVDRFGFDDISEKEPLVGLAEQLEAAHLESDPSAWQTMRAVKGRLPDGRKLLDAINDETFNTFVDSQFDAVLAAVLKALGNDFRSWFERLYSQPQTDIEDAWAPSYLEYQFAVSAPEDASGEKRATLLAEQYYHGSLDWFAFDIDSQRQLQDLPETQFPENSFEERPPFGFLPSQIEFNGMPNVRFWEFEDRRTDFGSIRAGTTDVPLLLLAEFGLIYGNDWTVIPYNLEVGTLADIKGIIVTDVFGIQTLIRPAGQGQRMDWQKWSMYNLRSTASVDAVDNRLFLPPSVAKVYESGPIEKVVLARDEMSNMVWGVEETIPGILGRGVDGFEAGKSLSNYFAVREPTPTQERTPNNAKIQYLLGTTVPENWIPFIPSRKPGSTREIRLQRAQMPRLTNAIEDTTIQPRGQILRVNLDRQDQRYFVHEEEVPRAGAIVTRKFQRARGANGEVFTWIGRRKETGRGEGASGLMFDQVVAVKE